MKILFFMKTPAFLRYYGSSIAALLDRGHDLHLVFDQSSRYKEFLRPGDFVGKPGRLTWGDSVKPGRWKTICRGVRGTLDYLLYLHPYFRHAKTLRHRMGGRLPWCMGFLRWFPTLPVRVVRMMMRALQKVERAIPLNHKMTSLIRLQSPDLVLITPFVTAASDQTDALKSAQALRLPTAVCVSSWDNLTTKGLIRLRPDRVIVWNDVQKREAVELHAIPPHKVIVTGAPLFDHWFERKPSQSASEFKRSIGLSADRPYLLFVGSTASMSPPELETDFVLRWIEQLRNSPLRGIRSLGVLVRPHPYNAAHWGAVDLSRFENVALWRHAGVEEMGDPEDKDRSLNFSEEARAGYFDSIFHSAAVVGINTSALIESAIVGRPVLTVLLPEMMERQEGTVHFHYLLPEKGGFLQAAKDFNEHIGQIRGVLDDTKTFATHRDQFVSTFVRPLGLDQPCIPHFIRTVESLNKNRITTDVQKVNNAEEAAAV